MEYDVVVFPLNALSDDGTNLRVYLDGQLKKGWELVTSFTSPGSEGVHLVFHWKGIES